MSNITTPTGHKFRKQALANFLKCKISEIEWRGYNDPEFSGPIGDYLVLTDVEAQLRVENEIKESVWAFRAGFILSQCELPGELEECIKTFQENKCDEANEALLATVEKCVPGGFGAFAEAAIATDGRGHFLNHYNGREEVATINALPHWGEKHPFYKFSNGSQKIDFYIYRIN